MSFAARYSLTACGDDEAVLVDLEGGAIYRLNGSAARVCAALAAGDDPAEALVRAYQLDPAAAGRDADAVRAQLAATPAPVRANPIRFRAERGGHLLCWSERPILWLSADGTRIEPVPGALAAAGLDPAQALLWAVPHALALQGLPLLHAAAVERNGAVVAFAGPSGAGKTALAVACAAAGAPLVARDLLVPRTGGGVASAGEACLQAWITGRAGALADGRAIDAADLAAGLAGAAAGPTLPLSQLWFLSAAGRGGTTLHADPVGAAEAMVLVLENSFAELETRAVWVDAVTLARRLAGTSTVARARVPDGLAALAAAARAWHRPC